jgi:hypothetical protein
MSGPENVGNDKPNPDALQIIGSDGGTVETRSAMGRAHSLRTILHFAAGL